MYRSQEQRAGAQDMPPKQQKLMHTQCKRSCLKRKMRKCKCIDGDRNKNENTNGDRRVKSNMETLALMQMSKLIEMGMKVRS